MPRIAVDLLGGDAGPAVVADALTHFLNDSAGSSICIVGPVELARDLLTERGIDLDHEVDVLHAEDCVPMSATSHETVAMIRDDATLSSVVGVEALRSGRADAFVSIGHTGATVAASAFGLGRLPGMGRLGLAVELPSLAGPVILLDCGAAPHATAEDLVRFAAAGRAYAKALGVANARMGLLSIGSERGKGDHLRKRADHLLSETFGTAYAGPLEGHDLVTEPRADVVVVDGFTGNVALKSMEGALRWSVSAMAQAYGAIEPAREVVRTSHFLSGGALLGLSGNVVVGHGASSATEVLACIRRAATMSTGNVVKRVRDALSGFAALDSRGEPT